MSDAPSSRAFGLILGRTPLASLVLRPLCSEWNHITGSPGPPAYRQQIGELLSLHNHMSLLIIVNLTIVEGKYYEPILQMVKLSLERSNDVLKITKLVNAELSFEPWCLTPKLLLSFHAIAKQSFNSVEYLFI